MKLTLTKHPGVLIPSSDIDADKLAKLKNGEAYDIDGTVYRNPAFHRKVFAFFHFCFEHWSDENTVAQFMDKRAQFEFFRNQLTVLAGFRYECYTIEGELRLTPKSLAYGNMEPDEFESCYNALIQAAMKHIFKSADEATLNRLYSFF